MSLACRVVKNPNYHNLPSEYQEVEYIESSGAQYIDIGIAGNIHCDITAQHVGSTSHVLISSTPSAASGSWIGSYNNANYWTVGNRIMSSIIKTTKVRAVVDFTSQGVSGKFNEETVSNITSITQGSWKLFSSVLDNKQLIYPFIGKVYACKITKNDALARDLIPCYIKATNEYGMYDLENSGKNIYDNLKIVKNYYISATGVVTSGTAGISSYSGAIKVTPGQTYTFSGISGFTAATNRIHGYTTDNTNSWVQQITTYATTKDEAFTHAFTIPSGINYIRISSALQVDTNDMLELANSATSYEPFPFYANQGTGAFTGGPDIENYILQSFVSSSEKTKYDLPSDIYLINDTRNIKNAYAETDILIKDLTNPVIETVFTHSTGDTDKFGNTGGIIWNTAPGVATYIRWGKSGSRGITYNAGHSMADLMFTDGYHKLKVGDPNIPITGEVPIYVDDIEIGHFVADSYSDLSSFNLPFRICAGRDSSDTDFKYFKLWDNGQLLLDVVSCYKNEEDAETITMTENIGNTADLASYINALNLGTCILIAETESIYSRSYGIMHIKVSNNVSTGAVRLYDNAPNVPSWNASNYTTNVQVGDVYKIFRTGGYGFFDNVSKKFYNSASTVPLWGGEQVSNHYLQPVNTRKVVKNPLSHLLPSEYQEVEYIESHGTEYIETNFIPKSNDIVFEYEAKKTSGTDAFVFYCYNGISLNINEYATKDFYVRFAGFNEKASTTSFVDWHTVYVDKTQAIYNDTKVLNIVPTQDLADNTGKIYLFANGAGQYKYYGSLKYLKFSQNGVDLAYFIPCYKKLTLEYGMYDLISNQFFGNKGTGAFTGGPAIDDYILV